MYTCKAKKLLVNNLGNKKNLKLYALKLVRVVISHPAKYTNHDEP